jgi:hypothetical protein
MIWSIHYLPIDLSHRVKSRVKIIVFGLIAGWICSAGISSLIVMVEKVTPVPIGAFYFVIMSTITQSHSYSPYIIIAGLLLHFVAGSLIGVIMAIPFVRLINNRTDLSRALSKYAPLYGLCFGFALWLILFIPITYLMVLPTLNNIKEAPVITEQDPVGRVASLVIGKLLAMQNRIIIGALAFNMFYGLVTAIIINSLCIKYLYKKKSDEDIVE